MICLVAANRFNPSAYNPRKADPVRLDLVELSLRKLGFLLPLYADESGEGLSGHQRSMIAIERLGCTKLPIVFLPKRDLAERKAVNIAFNRATNDFGVGETTETITERLQGVDIDTLAARLPDKDPQAPEFFPCMAAKAEPIAPLLAANEGQWSRYARNIARNLRRRGIRMPIVVGPDDIVVNGVGRLEDAAENKEKTILVVRVTADEAAFADAMLNLLSMDFDIHTRYADVLRFNSFRRARRVRDNLGRGFVFSIMGQKPANQFTLDNPANLQRWIREHGKTVLDFGAGHLHETDILRAAGIDVSPFEPYRVKGEEIDKAESIDLSRAFLADVASGKAWTSVFISSVLNSVPFREDREHIAALTAALCGERTRLYACATSLSSASWQTRSGREFINETHGKAVAFVLPYEEGITLGEISDKPKVQKYHSDEEFVALFQPYFQRVRLGGTKKEVTVICSDPVPVNPARLRAAIEFEFNLPYPDGTTMGLVDEALAAFSTRLGQSL